MKAIVAISSLAALFTCHALCAQQPPPRSAGGALAERFKQLDRNGDGKLTRDDMGQSPLFDQWDANKDGAVTMEEVTAFVT